MNSTVTRWWVINTTALLFAIVGFGFGVGGAAAVFTFFAWFYFLLAFAGLFIKDHIEDRTINMPVGRTLEFGVDALMTGILVWTGHWFIAILYLLAQFFVHTVFDVRFPSKPAQ